MRCSWAPPTGRRGSRSRSGSASTTTARSASRQRGGGRLCRSSASSCCASTNDRSSDLAVLDSLGARATKVVEESFGCRNEDGAAGRRRAPSGASLAVSDPIQNPPARVLTLDPLGLLEQAQPAPRLAGGVLKDERG